MTLGKYENDFLIAVYETEERIILPDGTESFEITAKGTMLPEDGLSCILTGDFTTYRRKDGRVSYTLSVSQFTELEPTDEESIVNFLAILDGSTHKIAQSMYDTFGNGIFHILETNQKKLTEVKGIGSKTAEKISVSYVERRAAKALFMYLAPYRISSNAIMRLYRKYKKDAVAAIKQNPYCVTEIAGIGWETAESIAQSEKIPTDFPERIKAGIIEVLNQGEQGGSLFQRGVGLSTSLIEQVNLRQNLQELVRNQKEMGVTGGTYLPHSVLYLLTLKLLDIPLLEYDFDTMISALLSEGKIFVSAQESENMANCIVYKIRTADSEYLAARKIASLAATKPKNESEAENLDERIAKAEAELNISLSNEQRAAVRMSLTHNISVITGGPGTGKTTIQRVILAVHKDLHPRDDVLLVAPTGRAARRMSDATGKRAFTIHSALSLVSEEDTNLYTSNGNGKDQDELGCGLVIADEFSMVGAHLTCELMRRIRPGTQVVLVGDIDQLPSIEVGAVLREIINSGVVPVMRLTQTYRQAKGSLIVSNAAQIRDGNVSSLHFGDDFWFVQTKTSQETAEVIADLYPKLVQQYGIDDVICLSSYRQKTDSGSNALNGSLQAILHKEFDEQTPYFTHNKQKIHPGDRIMYTRNANGLANGDVGELVSITRDILDGRRIINCVFNDEIKVLESDDTKYIELAYATTIHKSQGSEYKVVLMAADNAHKFMLRRNLVYTGITRAKELLIIVGQPDAFQYGVQVQDSIYRRSKLGELISVYYQVECSKAENEEKAELKPCLPANESENESKTISSTSIGRHDKETVQEKIDQDRIIAENVISVNGKWFWILTAYDVFKVPHTIVCPKETGDYSKNDMDCNNVIYSERYEKADTALLKHTFLMENAEEFFGKYGE